MRSRQRVTIAPAHVEVPVRRGLVCVRMRVAVHAAGDNAPERNHPESNQQRASKHFPDSLDDRRQRPPERNQRGCTRSEQQGVAGREPHRHSHHAAAPDGGCAACGSDRQRGDRHEVIRAEPVQEPEEERRGEEDQGFTFPGCFSSIVHATGTVTGA